VRLHEPIVFFIVSCAVPFVKRCGERNALDIREWITCTFLCPKRSDTNCLSKAAAQTSPCPYWNLWLFLALPAVWLAWSLIFFSTSLLSFIWTSGDRRVPELTPFADETMGFIPMSFKNFTPLWPRIMFTAVFIFGLGVGLLVLSAFGDIDTSKTERLKSKKRRPNNIKTSEMER